MFYLSIGIFQSILFSIDILLPFFMMKNTLFSYMLTFSILVSCFILNWYLYYYELCLLVGTRCFEFECELGV